MPFSSFQFTVNISMSHSSDLTSCHHGPQAPTSPGPKAPLQNFPFYCVSDLRSSLLSCQENQLSSNRDYTAGGAGRRDTVQSAACQPRSPRITPVNWEWPDGRRKVTSWSDSGKIPRGVSFPSCQRARLGYGAVDRRARSCVSD